MTLRRKTPLRAKKQIQGKAAKPKPRKAIKKQNPKRRASEFRRCYGSKARVEAIKTLACYGCYKELAENAHLPSRSGMSRKGDWDQIVDLGPKCHRRLHELGGNVDAFDREFGTDLRARAKFLAELLPADSEVD